jgi:hypothetical protein
LGGETIFMRNGAAVVIALHQYSLTLKMRAVCTPYRLDCKVITFASGQSSFKTGRMKLMEEFFENVDKLST